MRVVLQRVLEAKVIVDHHPVGEIKKGLLILVGVSNEDSKSDLDWIVNKIINLRIFSDKEGKMNLSLKDIQGEVLIVSQFTLFASTKKGNRPSYLRSAKPDIAIPLYDDFVNAFRKEGFNPEEGIFGADMKVHLVNDGPVTISIDSKNRE